MNIVLKPGKTEAKAPETENQILVKRILEQKSQTLARMITQIAQLQGSTLD